MEASQSGGFMYVHYLITPSLKISRTNPQKTKQCNHAIYLLWLQSAILGSQGTIIRLLYSGRRNQFMGMKSAIGIHVTNFSGVERRQRLCYPVLVNGILVHEEVYCSRLCWI